MKKKELVNYLAKKINTMSNGKTIIIGIDGVDASGKSSLARNLVGIMDNAYYLSIDMFHNKREIRRRQGEFSPEGFYNDSFNYEYVINHVLKPIKNNVQIIDFSLFDYHENVFNEAVQIDLSLTPIIIFEGIFLQRKETRDFLDYTTFLDVSFDTVLYRAVSRDLTYGNNIDLIKRKYKERYIKGQEMYFSEYHPKETANMVIDNNDYDNPIIIRY